MVSYPWYWWSFWIWCLKACCWSHNHLGNESRRQRLVGADLDAHRLHGYYGNRPYTPLLIIVPKYYQVHSVSRLFFSLWCLDIMPAYGVDQPHYVVLDLQLLCHRAFCSWCRCCGKLVLGIFILSTQTGCFIVCFEKKKSSNTDHVRVAFLTTRLSVYNRHNVWIEGLGKTRAGRGWGHLPHFCPWVDTLIFHQHMLSC